MKIAISTDGDLVSAHFGRCPYFTIIEVEGGEVKSKNIIDNPGHHPGFLPQFLQKQGVEVIIAGGMGQRAQELFNQAGIKAMMGISGKVDDIASKAAAGKLEGGESLCNPGAGKGYGVEKTACDNPDEDDCEHK